MPQIKENVIESTSLMTCDVELREEVISEHCKSYNIAVIDCEEDEAPNLKLNCLDYGSAVEVFLQIKLHCL